MCNSIFVQNNNADQLVRGMLLFAVLATLEKKENYAASILLELEDTPFETKAGTLYPLMTRMQKAKLLDSRWVIKKSKPPMRYYSITPIGKETLQSLRETMHKVNKVLGT